MKVKIIFLIIIVVSCNLRQLGGENIDNDEFNDKELAKHNEYRFKHENTSDLTLNNTLIKRAQGYAEELCAKNPKGTAFNWQHSNCTINGTTIGENLFAATWSVSGGQAADDWCNSYSFYLSN